MPGIVDADRGVVERVSPDLAGTVAVAGADRPSTAKVTSIGARSR